MAWYYYLIIGIAVVAVLVGTMFLCKKFKGFKVFVYQLVLEAEKVIKGEKMGIYKFDYVMDKIYQNIPKSLKPFLTEERIRKIIEWAVVQMKEMLEK